MFLGQERRRRQGQAAQSGEGSRPAAALCETGRVEAESGGRAGVAGRSLLSRHTFFHDLCDFRPAPRRAGTRPGSRHRRGEDAPVPPGSGGYRIERGQAIRNGGARVRAPGNTGEATNASFRKATAGAVAKGTENSARQASSVSGGLWNNRLQ
ncbi:Uncharacterised protein [Acinetobacter baumannii]|nr:Uncharacterised protein [Acinetobacter baumannii]